MRVHGIEPLSTIEVTGFSRSRIRGHGPPVSCFLEIDPESVKPELRSLISYERCYNCGEAHYGYGVFFRQQQNSASNLGRDLSTPRSIFSQICLSVAAIPTKLVRALCFIPFAVKSAISRLLHSLSLG